LERHSEASLHATMLQEANRCVSKANSPRNLFGYQTTILLVMQK
jgi:hypothetical protein